LTRSCLSRLWVVLDGWTSCVFPFCFWFTNAELTSGKADCGDIDVLITRPVDDGKTHAGEEFEGIKCSRMVIPIHFLGILWHLLPALREAQIITEDLNVPEDWKDLEAIYRGLCRLPRVSGARRRRIDFLTIPWEHRGAALLYYTGDDIVR
jgi:DNA polymerase lambda